MKPEQPMPDTITLRRDALRNLSGQAIRIINPAARVGEHWGYVQDRIEAAIIAAGVEVPECIPNFRCGLNALMRDAAPLPASAGTEERAWLIEFRDPGEHGACAWWDGVRFVTDPNKGVRFARHEDAERAVFAVGDEWRDDCLVTEHIWTAAVPDATKPQPSPAEVAWRFDDHTRDFYPTAPKPAASNEPASIATDTQQCPTCKTYPRTLARAVSECPADHPRSRAIDTTEHAPPVMITISDPRCGGGTVCGCASPGLLPDMCGACVNAGCPDDPRNKRCRLSSPPALVPEKCCEHPRWHHGLPGVNTKRGYCASCPSDQTWHDWKEWA